MSNAIGNVSNTYTSSSANVNSAALLLFMSQSIKTRNSLDTYKNQLLQQRNDRNAVLDLKGSSVSPDDVGKQLKDSGASDTAANAAHYASQYAKWDTNGDHRLSTRELRAYTANKNAKVFFGGMAKVIGNMIKGLFHLAKGVKTDDMTEVKAGFQSLIKDSFSAFKSMVETMQANRDQEANRPKHDQEDNSSNVQKGFDALNNPKNAPNEISSSNQDLKSMNDRGFSTQFMNGLMTSILNADGDGKKSKEVSAPTEK